MMVAEKRTDRKINVFWFRRDLRLEDNTALEKALQSGLPVLPVFIFDTNILDELTRDDARINFIHEILEQINSELLRKESSIHVFKGNPLRIWKKIVSLYHIDSVFINKDYEPYAVNRDNEVKAFLELNGIRLLKFKDQVIFEENEIVKPGGAPYTVFTPYSRKWITTYQNIAGTTFSVKTAKAGFLPGKTEFPSLESLGYRKSSLKVRPYDLSVIKEYHKYRDIPSVSGTSFLSPHLRFGTVSIRKLVSRAMIENKIFLNELIWREFFMQILFHFPHVVTGNFRGAYDNISWRNNESEFERWCTGETGYPIVDAGMRQLNETGYMHNRLRMITSGFLCKHLLTDWRRGEAYFAQKLLDYELSSNNGNWQWAAGTGCDAAPFFRIFNPHTQQKKFDPHFEYIRLWVPEYDSPGYPEIIIDHEHARQRALEAYKAGLKRKY